jgi:hypothetical protein
MIDTPLREGHDVSTTDRTLRQFAGLWLLFVGALAYWLGVARDRWTLAYVLAGLAVVPGLAGLLVPQVIRPLFVALMALTYPIGWVVSKVLLLVLYYGVFTPVGLVFRLIGRDALKRGFQPGQPTYWVPKPAAADLASYFRQS